MNALYFRILEPNAVNIVSQYMNDTSVTETNLPFWYNVNDTEFIVKVSTQNRKCRAGFEKMLNYILNKTYIRYMNINMSETTAHIVVIFVNV